MPRQSRRGRPPLAWLTPAELASLPAGTVVALERTGRHTARLVGRIVEPHPAGGVVLRVPGEDAEVEISPFTIKRGRTLPSLYEPGDPVLRRGYSASDWRGGVVRCEGTDVLVEQIGGSFAWFPETDLEPADARDTTPVAPTPVRAVG